MAPRELCFAAAPNEVLRRLGLFETGEGNGTAAKEKPKRELPTFSCARRLPSLTANDLRPHNLSPSAPRTDLENGRNRRLAVTFSLE